jgi:hypothetical protein
MLSLSTKCALEPFIHAFTEDTLHTILLDMMMREEQAETMRVTAALMVAKNIGIWVSPHVSRQTLSFLCMVSSKATLKARTPKDHIVTKRCTLTHTLQELESRRLVCHLDSLLMAKIKVMATIWQALTV